MIISLLPEEILELIKDWGMSCVEVTETFLKKASLAQNKVRDSMLYWFPL